MDDQQQYPRFKSAVHPVDTRGIAEVCREYERKLNNSEITLPMPFAGNAGTAAVLDAYATALDDTPG